MAWKRIALGCLLMGIGSECYPELYKCRNTDDTVITASMLCENLGLIFIEKVTTNPPPEPTITVPQKQITKAQPAVVPFSDLPPVVSGIRHQYRLSPVENIRQWWTESITKGNPDIVAYIGTDDSLPRLLRVVVKPIWHVRNPHLRKNDVIVFASAWKAKYGADGIVKFYSINGDEVGGLKIFGGAWVEGLK